MTPDLKNLPGVRFVTCAEAAEGAVLDEANIRSLDGISFAAKDHTMADVAKGNRWCHWDGERWVPVEERLSSDPLAWFLACNVEPDPASNVRSVALYEAYIQWCALVGEREWSAKAFTHAMKNAGYCKTVVNGVWWVGLRIVSPKTACTGHSSC